MFQPAGLHKSASNSSQYIWYLLGRRACHGPVCNSRPRGESGEFLPAGRGSWSSTHSRDGELLLSHGKVEKYLELLLDLLHSGLHLPFVRPCPGDMDQQDVQDTRDGWQAVPLWIFVLADFGDDFLDHLLDLWWIFHPTDLCTDPRGRVASHSPCSHRPLLRQTPGGSDHEPIVGGFVGGGPLPLYEGHQHHCDSIPNLDSPDVCAQRAASGSYLSGDPLLLPHLVLLRAILEHHSAIEILYVQCAIGCQ